MNKYDIIVPVGLIALILIIRFINKKRYKNNDYNSSGIIDRARSRTRNGCEKIVNKIKGWITGC